MLDHGGVRTFHGQFKCTVGFLAHRKTDGFWRGYSGIARANNFIPAANDRALHKTEPAKCRTTNIGHQRGYGACLSTARTLKCFGRQCLFGAFWRCC